MRLLYALCFLCVASSVCAVEITGFVNDEAGLFTLEEEQALTAIAQELYNTNRAQYAIVTTASLENQDIESYSIELAQERLGDTELDNGLLLVIAPNERLYRFEVGSGLEGVLTDGRMGRIGRTYLVDAFRQEQYGQGTIAASAAIRDILVEGVEPQAMQPRQDSSARNALIFMLLWFAFVITISIIQQRRRKKKKEEDTFWDAALAAAFMFGGRGGGGSGGGGFGGGGFSGGGDTGGW